MPFRRATWKSKATNRRWKPWSRPSIPSSSGSTSSSRDAGGFQIWRMGSERQADAERKAGEVIAEKIATHHARTLERQHMADIGGIMWSATSREIFEEGLQIPRMKLFEGGVPNETAFAFI